MGKKRFSHAANLGGVNHHEPLPKWSETMRNEILLQKTNRLYNGAMDPELGPVLATMGLPETKIQAFHELLSSTLEAFAKKETRISFLKQATLTRDKMYMKVRVLDNNLRSVIKLFDPKSPFLNMLKMETRYGLTQVTIPSENSDGQELEAPQVVEKRVTKNRNTRYSQAQERFQVILENIQVLPEATLATLANYGWGPENMERLTSAIQEYLRLCSEQEAATREFHLAVKQKNELKRSLIRDYRIYRNNILRQSMGHPLEEKLKRIAN